MLNYILNKKVEKDKVNNFKDLKGVGKEVWNFILAIYNVDCDALITNSNSVFFRSKVSAKFIPKINPPNAPKGNNGKNINKMTSINRIPPPISAKLPQEVNEIAKYFKKNNQSNNKTNYQLKGKMSLYAQATTLLINNTREVHKIKDTFLNL